MNYDINSPGELRGLPVSSLPNLCEVLRSFLIDHVASNGGHFSSSLGVVELAVALHYVFDMPDDKLVWDVGHQAYPHKLLTGRRSRFYSNRLMGGISGFPVMEESEFDAFGLGRSSTSISEFAVQGTQQQLHALYGYDKNAIVSLVRSLCFSSQKYCL